MNKFTTTDVGGLPIVLDDFRFIDDSVREAFFGIVTAWGVTNEESYILSGCEITLGVNISVAAGYVVIQGEVYKFNAQSITGTAPSGEEVTFVPSTAFDSAGNKTFDSGGTFDTYQLRTAALQYNIIAATNFKLFAALTIHEKIAALSAPTLGAWVNIDLNASADVVQIDAGATEVAPVQAPQAGSFLKYNIVGKTVNVVFAVKNLITTTFTISNATAIRFRNLPFTLKGDEQKGEFSARCLSHADGLSGAHAVKSFTATNDFDLNLETWDASIAAFNRFYEFTGTPSKNMQATAPTSFQLRWDLHGSFTFELD